MFCGLVVDALRKMAGRVIETLDYSKMIFTQLETLVA